MQKVIRQRLQPLSSRQVPRTGLRVCHKAEIQLLVTQDFLQQQSIHPRVVSVLIQC
jgi:hypothetical protein